MQGIFRALPDNGLLESGKERWWFFFSGLVLTFGFAVVYVLAPGWISLINNRIYDVFLRASPASVPSRAPVMVTIDEKSLQAFGQWPWPRYRVARLLNTLQDADPECIALDLVFAEADRTSVMRIQQEMARDLDLTMRVSGVPERYLDNDQLLAAAVSNGPYVLGYQFSFTGENPGSEQTLHSLDVLIHRKDQTRARRTGLFRADGVIANIQELSRAADRSGFFNVVSDADGLLRRAPLLMEYQGNIYPSLALAAVIEFLEPRHLVLKLARNQVESLLVGERSIPLDERGNLLLRFRGPGKTFPHVSASDVLNKQIDPARFKNRLVFVGTSAAGLRDLHATPFDEVFPGIEIHATIADNILQNEYLQDPQWSLGLELLAMVGVGLLGSVLLAMSSALWSVILLGLIVIGMVAGSYWLFLDRSFYVSPLGAVAVFTLVFSALSLLKFWWEEKRSRERTQALALVQEVTIETIATVTETRDPETGGHIKRTQHYVKALAEQFKKRKRSEKISDRWIYDLYHCAPLHDLGKVGIPDRILLKEGKLIANEFEKMKEHTVLGKKILEAADKRLQGNAFLHLATEIAYTHHERWDGSGYPQGLKKQEIPLAGRMMALADVYDALISKRVYKKSMEHQDVVQIIVSEKGTHFDPSLVDVFVDIQDAFIAIKNRFQDPVE
ncbi:MAG: CHASE2 domain-containing protein [Desulfohalobiaceae bacterium]|nr:CHASE2 domain-containing protein [Desulfohalobiaceae bacterium]